MVKQLELPFPEWKDIPGYEGLYQASTTGLVRRTNNHRMRKLVTLKPGYLQVELSKSNQHKKYFVHRLIMLTFKGVRPDGMQVNHINGIKADNRIENLEYVTPSQNIQHSVDVIKTHVNNAGAAHPMAKLTDSDVLAIRAKRESGMTAAKIAAEFSVSERTIMRIVNRIRWTHI